MDENIYAPPQSELIPKTLSEDMIASRWKRFFASVLDSLTLSVVTVPTMYFTGGFDGISSGVRPSAGYSLLIGLLAAVVFFAINIRFLIQSGQTIGKKALGIRIVDTNGNLPSFKDNLIKRYATYFLPAQIPVVGQILSVANIMFIFGKQRRCIHDYIGGTKVVEV